METSGSSENIFGTTILDVLEVHICRRAILDLVQTRDIVRSERVSRRWQQAVLGYLQHCRSVTLCYGILEFHKPLYSLSVMLQKLGPLVTHFDAEIINMKAFKIVASYCHNLRHLALATEFGHRVKSERELGKIFTDNNLDTIRILNGHGMTGEFFNCLTKDLKTLHLIGCESFNYQIMSKADCLRNITGLHISYNDCSGELLKSVPMLLNQMSKLETLVLWYSGDLDEVTVELADCIRRLENLKTIRLLGLSINDALLESLEEKCKKLEVLDIGFVGPISFWRGLVALVMRKPLGVTRFSFLEDMSREYLEDFSKKLFVNGCENITSVIVEVPPAGYRLYKVELRLVIRPVAASKPNELKIYLNY